MQTLTRILVVLSLLAVGYLCGSARLLEPVPAQAQIEGEPSQSTQDRIREAYNSMSLAMADLQAEQRYTSPLNSVNTFAVTVGGIDALSDLEDGRGVDPVTFAGLYAGQATEDIKPLLSYNEQGQLLYKDKLLRIYSPSRLQRLFAERTKLTEVTVE